MLQLKNLSIIESLDALSHIPPGKILINTINAHSYNTAQKDVLFAEALQNGDYLIPDGASIVKACRWLKANSRPTERVAGWDLFEYEMRAPSGSPKGEGTVCEPRGTTCESGIESGGLKMEGVELCSWDLRKRFFRSSANACPRYIPSGKS